MALGVGYNSDFRKIFKTEVNQPVFGKKLGWPPVRVPILPRCAASIVIEQWTLPICAVAIVSY